MHQGATMADALALRVGFGGMGMGHHGAVGTTSASSAPASAAALLAPPSPRSETYGARFASGFGAFRATGEHADVWVVVEAEGGGAPVGHALHSLLLAHRSEYFARALVWADKQAAAAAASPAAAPSAAVGAVSCRGGTSGLGAQPNTAPAATNTDGPGVQQQQEQQSATTKPPTSPGQTTHTQGAAPPGTGAIAAPVPRPRTPPPAAAPPAPPPPPGIRRVLRLRLAPALVGAWDALLGYFYCDSVEINGGAFVTISRGHAACCLCAL